MKTRLGSRRFLAGFLAFILCFTSMNFEGFKAYADGVENEVSIAENEGEISGNSDISKNNPEKPVSAPGSYEIRISNCWDLSTFNPDAHVKFEYSTDDTIWNRLYDGDTATVGQGVSVSIKVSVDDGYCLMGGKIRTDGAQNADDISEAEGEKVFTKKMDPDHSYEFEHWDATEFKKGLVINSNVDWETGAVRGNDWMKNGDRIQWLRETRYYAVGYNASATDFSQVTRINDGRILSVKKWNDSLGSWDNAKYGEDCELGYNGSLNTYIFKTMLSGKFRIYDDSTGDYVEINSVNPEMDFYNTDVISPENYIGYDTYIPFSGSKEIYLLVDTQSGFGGVKSREFFYGDADFGPNSIDSIQYKKAPAVGQTANENGYTVTTVSNTVLKFVFDTSRAEFNLNTKCVTEYSDGSNNTWTNEQPNNTGIYYSEKGLVANNNFSDGFPSTGNGDWGVYSCYWKTGRMTLGDIMPLHLALNDNDRIMVKEVSGQSVSDVKEYLNSEIEGKLVAKIKDETTGNFVDASDVRFYTTQDMSGNRAWAFEPARAGVYRVYFTDLVSDNNFVQITVEKQPKSIIISENSDLSNPIPMESIYWTNITNSPQGKTVYVKADDEDASKVEIIGFFLGDETQNEIGGEPIGYHKIGDTIRGISTKNNNGVAVFSVPGDFAYSSVNVISKFEYSDRRPEFLRTNIYFDPSDKGLVISFNVWTDFDIYSGTVDWSSVFINKEMDGNYKNLGTDLVGLKTFIFSNCTDDIADHFKAYQPVTSGLVPKYKNAKGEWVNAPASMIDLIYRGGEKGVSSECKGLWEIKAHKVGEYRIYASDGSFVTYFVKYNDIALYTSGTFNEETVLDNMYPIVIDKDKTETFYLNIPYDYIKGAASYNIEYWSNNLYGNYSSGTKAWSNPEINDFVKIEEESPTIFKVTISGRKAMINFTASYPDDSNWECAISYGVVVPMKGLVLNSTVMFDEFYDWGEKPTGECWDPWNFKKEISESVDKDLFFMLALNNSQGAINESDIKKLAGTTNLSVKKYDGTAYVDAGNAATLKYIDKSVYRFEAEEAGLYRIIYTKSGDSNSGSYVDITIDPSPVNMYGDCAYDEETATYSFEDANIWDGNASFDKDTLKTGIKKYIFVPACEEENMKYYFRVFWNGSELSTKTADTNPEGVTVGGVTLKKVVPSEGSKIVFRGENAKLGYAIYELIFNDGREIRQNGWGLTNGYGELLVCIGASDLENIYEADCITEKYFDFQYIDLSDAEISFAEVISNGEPIENAITKVTLGDEELIPNLDYYCIYTSNIFPGIGKVTVRGTGEFTGTEITKEFTIGKANLADYTRDIEYRAKKDIKTGYAVILECQGIEYSNFGGITVTEGRDYDLEKDSDGHVVLYEYDNAGASYEKAADQTSTSNNPTKYVKLLAKGDYFTGVKYARVYIENPLLSVDNIIGDADYSFTYSGDFITINPVVSYEGTVLTEGKDYELKIKREHTADTFKNGEIKDADTYSYTVEGKGIYGTSSYARTARINVLQYDISLAKTFKLLVKDETTAEYKELPTTLTYAEYQALPYKDVKAVVNGAELTGSEIAIYVSDSDIKDKMDVDIAAMSGNYTGIYTLAVSINSEVILSTRTVIEVSDADLIYDGTQKRPAVVVKNGENVVSADMYTVSYKNNVNAGKATVVITGRVDKNCAGTISKTFTINKAKLIQSMVNEPSNHEAAYVPGGATYDAYLMLTNGYILTEGTDYKCEYSNNQNAGNTATLKFLPMGNFEGEGVSVTFTVKKQEIDKSGRVNIDYQNSSLIYHTKTPGEKVTPQVAVVDENTVLTSGSDYTITYVKSDDSSVTGSEITSGEATSPIVYDAVVTGIGNYDGTITFAGVISASTYVQTDISNYRIDGVLSTYDTINGVDTRTITVFDGEGNLFPESKYSTYVDYDLKAGKGYVKVVPTEPEYKGFAAKEFAYVPYKVTDANFSEFFTVNNHECKDGLSVPHYKKDGKVCYPAIQLSQNYPAYMDLATKILREKEDYTCAWNGSELKITFKGIYEGTVSYSLGEIEKITILHITQISGLKNRITYSGKDYAPDVKIKAKAYTADGIEFTASLGKNDVDVKFVGGDGTETNAKNAGNYTVRIYPKGKYRAQGSFGYFDSLPNEFFGYEDIELEILPASIAKATVSIDKSTFDFEKDYEGGFRPGVTSVKLGKTTVLSSAEDYEVSYINNEKPGTATVVVTGKGNYTGEAKKNFTIDGKVDINDCDIDVWDYAEYSPNGALPYMEITYKGAALELNKDYKLSVTDNKKTYNESNKIATVTISGTGKYSGKTEKYRFKVIPFDFEDSYLTNERLGYQKAGNVSIYSWDFNGYKVISAAYDGKAKKPDPVVTVDGKKLSLGKDYTIQYLKTNVFDGDFRLGTGTNEITDKITDFGEYQVIISGKGNNYTGTLYTDVVAYITPPAASNFNVTVENTTLDAGATEPVKDVTLNGKKLVRGIDYEVYYETAFKNEKISKFLEGNLNEWKKAFPKDLPFAVPDFSKGSIDPYSPGNKKAYIIGRGDYLFSGVKIVDFKVLGYDISKATVGKIAPIEYYGADIEVEPDVYCKINGNSVKLEAYTDYSMEYKNNSDAGTATVIIRGEGRFYGTKKITFKILPHKVSEGEFDFYMTQSAYSSGKAALSCAVQMTYGSGFFVEGKDFTVSYKNNKKPASSGSKNPPTATIKFKGNYSGTFTRYFDIYAGSFDSYTSYVSNIASDLDGDGFVMNYKSEPVVKDAISGKTVAKKSNYTVTYVYGISTMVFDTVSNQYVTRNAGREIKATDKLLPGTTIVAVVHGIGNYKDAENYIDYIVTGK